MRIDKKILSKMKRIADPERLGDDDEGIEEVEIIDKPEEEEEEEAQPPRNATQLDDGHKEYLEEVLQQGARFLI